MKRSSRVLALALAVVLALGGGVAVWFLRQAARDAAETERVALPDAKRSAPRRTNSLPSVPGSMGALSANDRMARADKIRRDYDEMTAKFSADYSAAGAAFPGGLTAYLRQLALLQREKHKDLAALLTPRELEDLEMRDTNAGQAVQNQLGDTTATDEQRRSAFRLQKEFEDEFALTFDLSPPSLLARETERQATQQKIRAVLGDDLFGAWLRGEGPDYAAFAAFVQQQGLVDSAALDLWRAKSDFTLAQLQLKARTDLAPAQLADAQRLLASQALTRVTGIIGPAAVAGPGRDLLPWLPPPPAK